jgi:hypothetical protein
MKLFLIGLVIFNIGFLTGAWWGSGWARRQRDRLKVELDRFRGGSPDPHGESETRTGT